MFMKPLGIRPTIDFAFIRIFGNQANQMALISLINSILKLPHPIVETTIENPYNEKEFLEDKLSILDIRAKDQRGWIYDIEMQVAVDPSLIKRMVFYGCEVYADQLRSGDGYAQLKPVFTIFIIEEKLWQDSTKLHHAFRLADLESGRLLDNTLEVHTLELGWYNLQERDLEQSTVLEQWLFWLLHAHEYDTENLKKLFPNPGFLQATDTIDRIARITEDKSMYDMREKRLRDHKWLLKLAIGESIEQGLQQGIEQGLQQGIEQGIEQGIQQGIQQGIELGELVGQIVLLQRQLGLRVSTREELLAKEPCELIALISELEPQLRERRIEE
jgi:predicted transposase/invertase (TIGR01784 family)